MQSQVGDLSQLIRLAEVDFIPRQQHAYLKHPQWFIFPPIAGRSAIFRKTSTPAFL
jgi:hypothetical protein